MVKDTLRPVPCIDIVTCSLRYHWCMPSSYYLWMSSWYQGMATDCLKMIEWIVKEESNLRNNRLCDFFFSSFSTIRELSSSSSCCCIPIARVNHKNDILCHLVFCHHFNSIRSVSANVHNPTRNVTSIPHTLLGQFNIYEQFFSMPFHLILSCFIRFFILSIPIFLAFFSSLLHIWLYSQI